MNAVDGMGCCVGATAVSNELSKAGGRSVAAVQATQDGGLSIHTISLGTAGEGQHTTLPNLGLLTKDGAAVPMLNVFLTAGSETGASQLVGVSAADGALLALRAKATVCILGLV